MPVQADLGKSDMHYEPMEMTVVVTPAKVGKFIHIKFISCNNLDEATDSNIDIEFIGIVGFTGSKPNAVAQLSELEELGVVKRYDVLHVCIFFFFFFFCCFTNSSNPTDHCDNGILLRDIS